VKAKQLRKGEGPERQNDQDGTAFQIPDNSRFKTRHLITDKGPEKRLSAILLQLVGVTKTLKAKFTRAAGVERRSGC
jgi:hypothetical protein